MFGKRAEYILKEYGEKLRARERAPFQIQVGSKTMTGRTLHDPNGNPLPNWGRDEYSEEESDLHLVSRINSILLTDPTPHKEYSVWLTRQWISGEIRFNNDFHKVGEMLAQYDTLKTTGYFRRNAEQKHLADIGPLTVDKLATFIESLTKEDYLSLSARQKEFERELIRSGDAHILHDCEDTLVVQVNTHAASCHFGRHTRWCTAAARDPKTFATYAEDGALVIILDKANNFRWQMHVNEESEDYSLLDERDERLDDLTIQSLVTGLKVITEHFSHIDVWPPEVMIALVGEITHDFARDYLRRYPNTGYLLLNCLGVIDIEMARILLAAGQHLHDYMRPRFTPEAFQYVRRKYDERHATLTNLGSEVILELRSELAKLTLGDNFV